MGVGGVEPVPSYTHEFMCAYVGHTPLIAKKTWVQIEPPLYIKAMYRPVHVWLCKSTISRTFLLQASTLGLAATQPRTLQAHACTVTGLSFSSDGHYFASSSNDQTCRVWDSAHAFNTSSHEENSNSTVMANLLADSLANQLSLKTE